MVSYATRKAPSSASSSSAPSSPKVVNFDGVTGISRPVNNGEHWASFLYENHAAECRYCLDPYARYKAGKRLCSEGNRLALEISKLLYRKDGEVYSRIREDEKHARVEKPAGYDRSWTLLKAIERSSKGRHTFLTAEKVPEPARVERRNSQANRRSVQARTPLDAQQYAPYYMTLPTRPAEYSSWTAAGQTNPFYYYEGTEAKPGRGSLFEADFHRLMERDRREGQMAYTLEVREPSARRHSSRNSGYYRVRP